jgi:hypothetical protein
LHCYSPIWACRRKGLRKKPPTEFLEVINAD